jgi:hypothetical protein
MTALAWTGHVTHAQVEGALLNMSCLAESGPGHRVKSATDATSRENCAYSKRANVWHKAKQRMPNAQCASEFCTFQQQECCLQDIVAVTLT